MSIEQSISSSLEIRWFSEGLVPSAVNEWFGYRGASWESANSRTDYYLLIPHQSNCGIKFRESRFEIKTLVGKGRAFTLGHRKMGHYERWQKWSALGDSWGGLQAETIKDSALWVGVEKMRVLLFYNENTQLNPPSSQRLQAGCQVELSQIKFRRQDFWSIGFEAFGKENQLSTLIHHTIRKTDQDGLFDSLQDLVAEDNAWAYPAWLEQISRKTQV